MAEKILLLATHNAGKAKEFDDLLKGTGYKAVLASERSIDMEGAEETAPSFRGNSLIKAVYAYRKSGGKLPVVADDSGLCVWGLGGFPGVLSARFSVDGDFSYEAKQKEILHRLEGKRDRSASFFCALTYIDREGQPFQFVGEAKGRIAEQIRDGGKGFGYDPIFWSDELGKTFGEATLQEKDEVSHRAKASKAFLEFFIEQSGRR